MYNLLQDHKFKLKLGINDYVENKKGKPIPFHDGEIEISKKKIIIYDRSGYCSYERSFNQFYKEHAKCVRKSRGNLPVGGSEGVKKDINRLPDGSSDIIR